MAAPAAIARLPGIVQGVVVQITTDAPISACTGADRTGKRTQIVVLEWSWYSISASASAVFSTGDHITGRSPRYSAPFSRNLQISAAIAASDWWSIVA